MRKSGDDWKKRTDKELARIDRRGFKDNLFRITEWIKSIKAEVMKYEDNDAGSNGG